MVFLVICVALATFLSLFYWMWTNNFNYWKNRGIPGPKPNLVYGNTKSFVSKSVSHCIEVEEIYRKYRDNGFPVVGYYAGRKPHLLVTDPQATTEILVKNFTHFYDNEVSDMVSSTSDPILSRNPFFRKSDGWKTARKQLVPGLSTNRVKTFYPIIRSVCKRLTGYIELQCKKSSNVDIDDVTRRFTTEVISDIVFGVNANALTGNESTVFDMGKRFLEQFGKVNSFFAWAGMVPLMSKLYKYKILQDAESSFFKSLIRQSVESREKGGSRQDFVQFLVRLKETMGIDVTDMTGHAMTIYLDGADTASLGISHILQELAKNPDAQKKLRDEIQENRKTYGEEIPFDVLSKMEYLDAVIHESIRLHPPIGVIVKQCTKTFHLNHPGLEKPIEIPCGTPITFHTAAIQRDPKNYENPLEFVPERFFNDNAKIFNEMGIFLGFGGGPRICLGRKLALAQLKSSVCEIIGNFSLSADTVQRPEAPYYGNFFNYPHKNVILNVKKI